MKRTLLLLVLCLFCSWATVARETREVPVRKKVGLVMSGGGAKGFAHIGALKVLVEAGIPIDYVAGTSAGALIGALYAIGYTPEQMEALVQSKDWLFIISDGVDRYNQPISRKKEEYLVTVPFSDTFELIPPGLVRGNNIQNLFSDLTIGYHDSISFSELPVPFGCIANDLVDGSESVLDHGVLMEAMRASMAIPGMFSPVTMDGKVLIDGGTVNNFPVDLVKRMGAEVVIGIDIQADLRSVEGLDSATGVMDQLTSLMGRGKFEENLKMVDLYIRPETDPFNATSYNDVAVDSLLIRGERKAREMWDEILAFKEQVLGIPRDSVPLMREPKTVCDTFLMRHIMIRGLEDPRDLKWVATVSQLQEGRIVSLDELHRGLSLLSGTSAFKGVNYRLHQVAEDVFDLELFLDRKSGSAVKFGARFDSEEMASLLFNGTFSYSGLSGTQASVTAKLGFNPFFKVDLSLGNTFLRRMDFSYVVYFNELSMYAQGMKRHNVSFVHHMVDLRYANVFWRNFLFEFGWQYEKFNFDAFLNVGEDMTEVVPEDYFNYFVRANFDTYNQRSFPDSGVEFNAGFTLYTDNMYSYKGGSPFAAVNFNVAPIYAVSDDVVLIPSLRGRFLLFNSEVPYFLRNCMGGLEWGRYLPQQMPFTGLNNVELFNNSLLTIGLKGRCRVLNDFYASGTLNMALHGANFDKMFFDKPIWGFGAGFAYNSFIGPIELTIHGSPWTSKAVLYFGLGYYF